MIWHRKSSASQARAHILCSRMHCGWTLVFRDAAEVPDACLLKDLGWCKDFRGQLGCGGGWGRGGGSKASSCSLDVCAVPPRLWAGLHCLPSLRKTQPAASCRHMTFDAEPPVIEPFSLCKTAGCTPFQGCICLYRQQWHGAKTEYSNKHRISTAAGLCACRCNGQGGLCMSWMPKPSTCREHEAGRSIMSERLQMLAKCWQSGNCKQASNFQQISGADMSCPAAQICMKRKARQFPDAGDIPQVVWARANLFKAAIEASCLPRISV